MPREQTRFHKEWNRHMTETERFFEKTAPDRETGCLLWVGSRNRKGYGMCRVAGQKNAKTSHRRAWEIAHGDVPPGLHVLHKCDTPACVNVDHLFLGTNRANMADRGAKGRTAKGEQAGRAKLTEGQVKEIAGRYAAGGVYQRELAAEYGVSRTAISYITRGDSWKCVETPVRFGKKCARSEGGAPCQ